jgi:hypothetical protein
VKLWALKHWQVKHWQVKSAATKGGALLVALILSGCADTKYVTRTVKVQVPVAQRATPPPELMAPYRPQPMPIFVSPDYPLARAALTEEGIDALWLLVADLVARDSAWRAWAQ